jgi:hypothetical protein
MSLVVLIRSLGGLGPVGHRAGTSGANQCRRSCCDGPDLASFQAVPVGGKTGKRCPTQSATRVARVSTPARAPCPGRVCCVRECDHAAHNGPSRSVGS